MEAKHVKLEWSGRSRQQSSSLVDVDTRRRIYTPTLIIPRPFVRRHSVNGIHFGKGRTISQVTDTGNKIELSVHGRRQDVVKTRDTTPRKQAIPAATQITGEQNIKPILKSSRDKTVPKILNLSTSGTAIASAPTVTSPKDDTGGKFCYKLPQQPAIKLRKSVSFQDDLFSSAQNSERLSPQKFFNYRKNRSDTKDAQIFV